MLVPVMYVGTVRVSVNYRRVNVRVGVRFAAVPRKIVGMPMMFIVRVGVRVLLRLVCVQMPMMFGKVQPDTGSHQQSRGDELQRNCIPLNQDR